MSARRSWPRRRLRRRWSADHGDERLRDASVTWERERTMARGEGVAGCAELARPTEGGSVPIGGGESAGVVVVVCESGVAERERPIGPPTEKEEESDGCAASRAAYSRSSASRSVSMMRRARSCSERSPSCAAPRPGGSGVSLGRRAREPTPATAACTAIASAVAPECDCAVSCAPRCTSSSAVPTRARTAESISGVTELSAAQSMSCGRSSSCARSAPTSPSYAACSSSEPECASAVTSLSTAVGEKTRTTFRWPSICARSNAARAADRASDLPHGGRLGPLFDLRSAHASVVAG